MAELQGSAAKAAYKQAATWGTAVALGDGDQVEYASESITPDAQLVDSDQITGEALSGASDVGSIIVQGDLGGMDLKYNGHERFMRAIFGSEETPVADGTGWKHEFNFGLSNEGEFGTLAFEKVVDAGSNSIHEIDSWKPMGATFDGQPGQPVKLTIRGIGHSMSLGESATNVASTTWSLPGKGGATDARKLVKFGQVKVEIATVSGGVVGAFADLCASAFNISFQRNGDPVPTTCSGDYADEPATDTVEITGQLDFPIYNDDNHFLVEANMAKSVLSLRFTFDSGVEFDTGKNYKWVLHIPAVQLTSGYPNVSTKGRVPLSVQWKAHNAEVAVDTDATMPRLYIHNDTADIDDYSNA
jgi:hypothetical protein